MVRSYAVTITYNGLSSGHYTGPQILYLQAATAGLFALLHALNSSPDVISFTVCNTLTIPELSKLTKLTRNDLGLPADALNKLK